MEEVVYLQKSRKDFAVLELVRSWTTTCAHKDLVLAMTLQSTISKAAKPSTLSRIPSSWKLVLNGQIATSIPNIEFNGSSA